jgi:predicted RND superfamily exporter protein
MQARVDRIARLVTRHPRWVVGAVLVLTLVLAYELRHLRLEVRLSDEVPKGHPYTLIDDRLGERLGAHQTAIVAIGALLGDVLNPDTLARIRRLTDGVARIEGVVPSSVLRLTAPHVKSVAAEGGCGARRVADPAEVPSDAASLTALRARILSLPMYVGTISRPTRAAR